MGAHFFRRGRSGRKGIFATRLIIRGRRGERGASLIEFSLVMIPFFVILFGIFEVGFVFWGSYELENATDDAARQIRTGQASAANMSEDGFRALVCSRVVILTRCNEELRLDVRSFDNYSAIAAGTPNPLNNEGEFAENLSFTPGAPRSIMLVSTFYRWPLINFMSRFSLSNMAGGDRLLRASAAFRNEPFPEQ